MLGKRGNFFVPGYPVHVPKLRFQTVAARHQVHLFPMEQGFFGTQQRIVKANQHVSAFHPVAIARQNFSHRAAVDVLHDLVAGLHLDMAHSNNRA